MATPLLIDTDLGVDDAVAVSLSLACQTLDVRAIVGVGGGVELEQVMRNLAGLLRALSPLRPPMVGRGLDPAGEVLDRREAFGRDGLGECGLPLDPPPPAQDGLEVYRRALEQAGGELVVLTTGPLTNLAAVCRHLPEAVKAVRHVYVTGGAAWTQGHAGTPAEYNFRRDPAAAAAVLSTGLPITVAPLDVAKLVVLDESHVARLAASGYRTGETLARLLRYPLEQDSEPACGKTWIHAAVAAGGLVWPNLFMKTRMRLEITTSGRDAGRCRPALGGDRSKQVDLLTAVNAADFIENLLESLNHEAFVV